VVDSAPQSDSARPPPRLVPVEVSLSKLGRQLEQWRNNEAMYTARGWVLLNVTDLSVTVGFLVNLPVGLRTWPVMTACIRLEYDNFDLWPPSVTLVDPFTRQPTLPLVQAPDEVNGEVRDVLVSGHPVTGLPFLCLPGVREYHTHPQHSGDDWLLHRNAGAGNLTVICERVWRRMARNVLGVALQVVALRRPANPEVQLNLVQGDADAFAAQIAAAQAAAAAQTPAAAAVAAPQQTVAVAEAEHDTLP
jgi:hypothetical protein